MDEVVRGNFIWDAIEEDLAAGNCCPDIHARFPPEPNGYLHIGHLKAICINFETARRFGGKCNLRFDDTNPSKEDTEYVESMIRDIRWMGYEWDKLIHASDYSERYYQLAEGLIEKGLAYVCDLSPDEMREYRGTLTEPGKNSPYRDRSPKENLGLFRRMRAGEFADGTHTLRAKIDMASPNINMRDPVIYRILHVDHYRTGSDWCIYPMYDYAHPLQDAFEKITHSLCSLEFEAHRPLYEWVARSCGFTDRPPRQIEFARLNITRTIMSKRYLRRLVEEGAVAAWDDPRMPTISGMRRRGYPPAAIRDFIGRAGVAKADSTVDFSLLEHCVREALSETAPRVMVVLRPLKVILENWPEDKTEEVALENLPGSKEAGTHTMRFGRTVYIERDDFMVNPPKKYFRLFPGGEVRLRGAYIVKCTRYETDENGLVTHVYCTYDPDSRSGDCARKVKGTLHWVSEADARKAEVRLYDPLLDENEESGCDFMERLNPTSLETVTALAEPYAVDMACAACDMPADPSGISAASSARMQFLRQGYFCVDPDSTKECPVFNRIVELKDSWKKR